jgi:hypothetical protein
MNIYPLFVIGFSLLSVAFGLYLYAGRSGAASLVGGILSTLGLILALIATVAWLLPGFFFNIS